MIIHFLTVVLICFFIYWVYLECRNSKAENEILELKKKKELADYERFKSRYHFLKDVFDLDCDDE